MPLGLRTQLRQVGQERRKQEAEVWRETAAQVGCSSGGEDEIPGSQDCLGTLLGYRHLPSPVDSLSAREAES